MSRLDAVLFDMDGLLVDTEPQWFAAEGATVTELGGVWGKNEQHALLGTNLEYAADYMIAHTGSRLTQEAVMKMLFDNMTVQLAKRVDFQPGALTLLDELAPADVRVGMVTSSVRDHVAVVLARIPDHPFEAVVTADDVPRLKPDPLPYLTALEQLGVRASHSVVLEDSPHGVQAGEQAGCHVVAVPSVVPIPPAPGRSVVPSLIDLSLSRLEALVLDS
jgi:HAD superfamily hydrolase (TIGR01509 family)